MDDARLYLYGKELRDTCVGCRTRHLWCKGWSSCWEVQLLDGRMIGYRGPSGSAGNALQLPRRKSIRGRPPALRSVPQASLR